MISKTQYKSWSSFTFMGRKFLALEDSQGQGFEIYGEDLTPMYKWMEIEHFKRDLKAGKLPEFEVTPKHTEGR